MRGEGADRVVHPHRQRDGGGGRRRTSDVLKAGIADSMRHVKLVGEGEKGRRGIEDDFICSQD
jgi:hypothetical protein